MMKKAQRLRKVLKDSKIIVSFELLIKQILVFFSLVMCALLCNCNCKNVL